MSPPTTPRSTTAAASAVWRRERSALHRFFGFTYLTTLLACLPFLTSLSAGDLRTEVFAGAVWLTYGLIYGLPAMLLGWLSLRLLSFGERRGWSTRWAVLFVRTLAVSVSASALGLLLVDAAIHDIYGFHVNGFVINLVTTPGGIESMGASTSTYVSCALIALGLLLWQAALLWLAHRGPAAERPVARFWRPRTAVFVLLALSVAERLAFGVAHVQNHQPTLLVADAFPLYDRLTFDHLAKRYGYEIPRRSGIDTDVLAKTLCYPKRSLEIAPPPRPLNIVWIVSESLRADALDPEIMPHTWAFAQQADRFTNHYSGGNGTRMGVFSMFYGLYGNYWFPFLDERRGPVLIDALIQQHYQFSVHTSARFSYPEFDSTVFCALPPEVLHEWSDGESWERDREHVDSLLSFIEHRDRTRPFMTFSFFESPHADYSFPEDSVIREPYLEDFNYATMDLDRDIELIRNRYLNCCHHLDTQIQRILEVLRRQELLDDTLVLITGDHGEEFMEHGHWGHGSTFAAEQVRVPLVLWVPGRAAARIDRMTSHVDLPATILPLLGVRNPPAELSLGQDLFGSGRREYVVVADWYRLCIVTAKGMVGFPMSAGGAFRTETRDANGEPTDEDSERFVSLNVMVAVMNGLNHFRR